tara:strand:+ start:622 stop:834 length:213 start_codon:yes stop_codon:yes gene_type:complete
LDDAEIDQDDVLERLLALKQEHRDLDDALSALVNAVHYDQIQVQRLKKRKLALRDLILRLENILLPDIIA